MKSLAVFVLFAAQSVFAATAWMQPSTRQVRWFRPESASVGDVTYTPPTDANLADAGFVEVVFDDVYGDLRYRVVSWSPPAIRAFTPAEKAAADLADAEAAAQAEYEASLPVPVPTGVEVPWVVFLDATNRQIGVAMELTTNCVPIFYEFHASPVDWAKVESNRAAAIARWSAKVKDIKNAKSQGGGLAALGARVAALEAAVAGVE